MRWHAALGCATLPQMARPALTDYLQSFPFWMMDISTTGAVRVFDPALGFASITMPEVSVTTFDFREGNDYFDRHVVQRGTTQAITARRGATFYDSDFYIWVMQALTGGTQFMMGDLTYRKDLLLIHYFARGGFGPDPERNGGPNSQEFIRTEGPSLKIGPLEYSGRIPARAYRLVDCIPTRWRPGSDLDATDGSISIAEIDFAYESIEEVSLAASTRYLASLPFA